MSQQVPRRLSTVVFLAFLSGFACAQVPTSSINGFVTDPKDAVVAGAHVTASNLEQGISRTTLTNSSGLYSLADLPAGIYDVQVQQPGFGVSDFRNVILLAGKNTIIDARLRIAVFPLPISLTANWVLRITQLRPSEDYITAVLRSLFLLAVIPTWVTVVFLSLPYRPVFEAGEHLAVLLLFGFILADLALIGFHKIPFTCSLLPGKTNFQYLFWGTLVGVMLMVLFALSVEFPALHHPGQCALLLVVLAVAAADLALRMRIS